jgi:hypothetical protein
LIIIFRRKRIHADTHGTDGAARSSADTCSNYWDYGALIWVNRIGECAIVVHVGLGDAGCYGEGVARTA